MKGCVFSGKLAEESLEELIHKFFRSEESFYIFQDIDIFEIKKGLPTKFAPKGRVFSGRGEIRWKKGSEDYSILAITENPISELSSKLSLKGERWTLEEKKFILINPQSPNLDPSFEEYPNGAKFITVKVYLKDGVPIIVSPRGFRK